MTENYSVNKFNLRAKLLWNKGAQLLQSVGVKSMYMISNRTLVKFLMCKNMGVTDRGDLLFSFFSGDNMVRCQQFELLVTDDEILVEGQISDRIQPFLGF